ncbi:MAG: TatD family hydrolase [Mucispirillum sp.]|nr:TatD family hydrolase [Mucispirillum sp.]
MKVNFWTDTHAHIHDDEYGRNVDDFISMAYDKNVKRIITIGIDYDDSIKALKTAEQYNNIYAAVGMHPEYADKYTREKYYEQFYKLASNKKVVAVGETGLDFYYEENPDEKYQNILFEDMADIAGSLDKPLVIHSRNAVEKTVKILDKALEKHSSLKGIFHCFDGSISVLDWIKDKNFYISYAGNVTFKSAENLRQALINTPVDKLLIETDSPYLAPVPVRGKKNMPANVSYTGEYVAEFLNMPYNILMEQLENNLQKLMKGGLQ